MYGDTAAARKRVSQLREQAGDIRATADRIVSRAESVPWHGRAAESMRARIKERAAQLRTTAAAHDTAADSLARHLAEVDRLKDAIEVRERKARSLVDDAHARAAKEGRAPSPDDTDDEQERALLAFSPPAAGHRDWLTTELPGL